MPHTKRSKKLVLVALALGSSVAIVSGCERSGRDEQEKIQSAQREAEKKTGEAVKESTTKITSAQAEVDKKVAESTANFVKTREDYRTKLTSELADIDRTIQKLQDKAKTASGKTKAELEAALPDIMTKRQTLGTDSSKLDMATLGNWDATKNQLDNDMEALKAALDKAPSVLPANPTPRTNLGNP